MNTPLNPDAVTRSIMVYQLRSSCGVEVAGECKACRSVVEAIVSAYLAAAQPVVNSVESFQAKMRMLMWEGGEFEVAEIPEGHVLVGFEMETDRAWSMADKVTINIERPEVK